MPAGALGGGAGGGAGCDAGATRGATRGARDQAGTPTSAALQQLLELPDGAPTDRP